MTNTACSPDHRAYRYSEEQLLASCAACGQQWPIPTGATNAAIADAVMEQLRDRFPAGLPASLDEVDADLSVLAGALADQRTDPWVEVSHGVEDAVDAQLRARNT